MSNAENDDHLAVHQLTSLYPSKSQASSRSTKKSVLRVVQVNQNAHQRLLTAQSQKRPQNATITQFQARRIDPSGVAGSDNVPCDGPATHTKSEPVYRSTTPTKLVLIDGSARKAQPKISEKNRQNAKASKKATSEAQDRGYWRYNGAKSALRSATTTQCISGADNVQKLYTATNIATGRRSRHTSQSQSATTSTASSSAPADDKKRSNAAVAVNLNDYEYPAFARIQKNEPKCAHIKRIDRNQSIGHGYILALQSPAIRASLNPPVTNVPSAPTLYRNELAAPSSPDAASLGILFNESFTLFCLDCCSRYSTIDELSYKVRNYHVCNNHASQQFNQKCPSVLFLEKQTLGIYCAECNRFLLQDNKQDDLREIKTLAQTQLGLNPSLNLRKLHQWSVCYSRLTTLRKAVRAFREGTRKMKIERLSRLVPTALVRYTPIRVQPSASVMHALQHSPPVQISPMPLTPDVAGLAMDSPAKLNSPITIADSPPTPKTRTPKKPSTPSRVASKSLPKQTPPNSPHGSSQDGQTRAGRKRLRASPVRTTTERIKVYDPRGIINRKLPEPLDPSQIQNDPTTYLSNRRSNPDKTPSPPSSSGTVGPTLTSRQQAKSNHSSPPTPIRDVISVEELAEEESKYLYPTRGLKNLGNTCYMNTVVQALSYIPQVVHNFIRTFELNWQPEHTGEVSLLGHGDSLKNDRQNTEELANFGPNPLAISRALYLILNSLRYVAGFTSDEAQLATKATNVASSVHNPADFMKMIRTFPNFETPHEQHDAHEFLVKLIDSQINCRDTYSYPSALRYSTQDSENSKIISKLFHQMFMGELTQITTCLCCQSVHHTTETLQTLTVTIEQTNIEFQQQDTIPAYLLDDLHEVRKYNLRKRNTSTDNNDPAESANNSNSNPEVPKPVHRTGRKQQKRGNKRGTASKRAQGAKSAEGSSSKEASTKSSSKRRKLESPVQKTNTAGTSGAANQPLILPLESLLDDFFKQESLDVYCQKCYEEMKETQPGNTNQLPIHKVKQYQISRLPAVFILHINRSKYKAGYGGVIKDSTPVEILQRLDFRPYCRKSRYFSRPDVTQYQLSAVIVHDGRSISSGHYRVYCLNYAKQQWLHINDSKIKAYSFEEITAHEKEPYLLFYSKCTDY